MSDNQTDFILEALKQTKRTWTIYSVFIAYAALTVLGASDRQIVLNESVRLPILNSEIPLNAYFIITPLLSIILFLYFHLQLHILRQAIPNNINKHSESPKRLYPWIILVAEDPDPGAIGWFQKFFVSISIWWSLPLILMLYAVWIIKKHNPWLSYSVGLMPLLGIILLIFFWCKFYKISLPGLIRKPAMMRFVTIAVILNMFLLFILVPWANKGKHFGFGKDYHRPNHPPPILQTLANLILTADLRREILSAKPIVDYDGIYWIDLSDIHLEGADLTGSVLKKADLRLSHLQFAKLNRAELSEANLSWANLCGAWLMNSKLEKTNLHMANLAGILATHANLKESSPSQANFNGADLSWANLEKAKLNQSNFENAKLYKTNLCRADIRNGNFRRALLQYADLAEADLENAWFDEANLIGVKNLTIDQLSKVKTLYKTIMDQDIKKEIVIQFPHLLDKPIEKERPRIKFEMIFPGWDIGWDWYKMNRDIYFKEHS